VNSTEASKANSLPF